MSRSYRKPYYENNDGSKKWKRESNRNIRRNLTDLPDGNYFRKMNDARGSPMENKGGYWDISRLRRK